ncbi:MAG TPA: HlyD family efflux transporter periplasmic adaptor subunit, partial [Pirellulales bacterium]
GEWVNPGDPVVRILRIDRLRVEALLNARDFGPEIAGSLVTLDVTMPGGKREQFPGKLVFVHPEIEPVTGNFRVWAEVENRQLMLRPGLIANMTIHLSDAAATARRQ